LRGAALGLAGLGLAGCTSNTETPTAAPAATAAATAAPTRAAGAAPAAAAPAAQPKLGGKLAVIVTFAERTLDPHMLQGAAGGIGNNICYSNLVTYKWGPDIKPPSYTPTGDLAESWTTPDETTYLFKLRQGVKFHNIPPVNGRELVADDVVYSLQRIRDLKTFAGLIAGVTKFEAPDKYTVKLTLDKPNPDLLINLCEAAGMAIVAKEQVDAQKDLTAMPVIGTGAWIAEDFVVNDHFFAKKNPDYFVKGQPYVDRIESFRTTDPTNVLNAFRSNTVQVVGSGMYGQSGEDLLKSVPKAQVYWILLERNPSDLWVNTKAEPFGDLRVRQAIHKAIDRKAIIDTVLKGHGQITSGIIMPTQDAYLPESELNQLFARDVAGAKKLMSDAGKSAGFDVELLTANYLQGAYVSFAELIQANLKEIGINTKIIVIDAATIAQRQQQGNWSMLCLAGGGFGTANGLLYSRHYTGGPQNYAGYSSPDLDKLIDQQAVMSKDTAGRKRILQDIQRKIINDAVYMNLHFYEQPTMAQAEIRGFYPPVGINSHNNFWTTMWIDK
jgi:peptide/nickel transport system substrate-binding protein